MVDRERAGREASPSAGVIDSQSVKAPHAATRGYEGLSGILCAGDGSNIGGSVDLEAVFEQDRELCPGHGPFPERHSPLPLG